MKVKTSNAKRNSKSGDVFVKRTRTKKGKKVTRLYRINKKSPRRKLRT